MPTPKIYPVVHYLDRETAFSQIGAAVWCGADGAFLISHHGNDMELIEVCIAVQAKHPGFPIGINLLSTGAVEAASHAVDIGCPMLWGDDMGVDSTGLHDIGKQVASIREGRKNPALHVFASVAFKYRPHEPDPARAALNALKAGFIPCTSGPGTGHAPDLAKIVAMSEASGGVLAVASGMTPWNVAAFAPHLSHILVATGVAIDEHRLDEDKLRLFIANARVDVVAQSSGALGAASDVAGQVT